MSVFRRGQVYWFEFQFNGSRIRESAKTSSKTIAKQAEQQRRRELERGINRLSEPRRMPLLKVAAEQWLSSRRNISAFTRYHYEQYLARLSEHFGDRLICDIRLEEIAALQHKRISEGHGNRRVNAEIQVLRQVLKHFGLWAELQGRVHFLREPHDVGRAMSREDEPRLLEAAGQGHSPALLPRIVLAMDTGIRANEMRQLRYRDLTLDWKGGAVERGWLVVSRSKTEGGTGRSIPLSKRTCAVLTLWLSRFSDAPTDGFVFPRHKVGLAGDRRETILYDVDFKRPSSEWKNAWRAACRSARVRYRWHDLRHTFISRLAENPSVSEGTIMALAGHVSKSMLARYSHIRQSAKQAAIDALETAMREAKTVEFDRDSPQNPPHSHGGDARRHLTIDEKSLN